MTKSYLTEVDVRDVEITQKGAFARGELRGIIDEFLHSPYKVAVIHDSSCKLASFWSTINRFKLGDKIRVIVAENEGSKDIYLIKGKKYGRESS